MTDWVAAALAALEGADRRRHLVALTPLGPTRARFGDRVLTLFSSNDYLGLSAHPAVRQAAARAATDLGMGSRSSALICGFTELAQALEHELAALKGTAAALVFATGYAANLGVLGALGGTGTAFFSDALNHASIIDGCRLARGTVHVYRHADLDHLETLLAGSAATRKVIVTDGVFSMDGEVAPLRGLAELKTRHGAMLVVDEAHATLLYGPTGAGVVEAAGLSEVVELQVGTLSKAVGSQGGYVACSVALREWLLNRARAYIFSTALAAPMIAAARESLALCAREPQRRERLWSNTDRLRSALELRGRSCERSPIVPLLLGSEERALAASAHLLEHGIHATAIRPPTVPPGTCRLRVTLSSEHTPADIDALATALKPLIEEDRP